jgi:hypothetical protein
MNDNDKQYDRRDEIEVSFRRVVFRGPVAIIAGLTLGLLVIQQLAPLLVEYLQGRLVAPAMELSDSSDE